MFLQHRQHTVPSSQVETCVFQAGSSQVVTNKQQLDLNINRTWLDGELSTAGNLIVVCVEFRVSEVTKRDSYD